jgi:phenylacetic acid degradation protein
MFYSFKGYIPVVDPTSFVHPLAVVTGNVIIGKHVYVGPGAHLRGDWGAVLVEEGCNIQENCTLHMFPGKEVVLEQDAHIGHGAVIHGARIGRNSMVGMNAVVMDDVVLEEGCIVGALAFLKAGEHFSARSLIVGNPAKRIKEVSEDMLHWKTMGTALYQTLPLAMQQEALPCEPLSRLPEDRPSQEVLYETWKKIKEKNK